MKYFRGLSSVSSARMSLKHHKHHKNNGVGAEDLLGYGYGEGS